jgi:uncharacterized protein YggE
MNDMFANPKQPTSERQIFSVSADAIVKVPPDKVVLNIGAETKGENLNRVKETNFDIIKNTLQILKKNGIEDKHIGTNYVDISTWYAREYEQESYKNIRFTVSQSLSVILTDVSKYDKILTEVINIGINQVHNIEFQTSELKKHRYAARSLAIAAAKEKAEFLAHESGIRLGNVINLHEYTNDYSWRPYRDRYGTSQNMSQSNFMLDSMESTESDSESLAPGMISIKSNITLYYNVAE